MLYRAPSSNLVRASIFVGLLTSSCMPAPPVRVDPGPPAPVVDYVTRQEILTPLPLRVSLPSSYGADRVLVFFRTWGSRDWSLLELNRAGQTWSGEVSCREVSTVTGDTRYFFLALADDGRAVASSGSPGWPHVATVVGELPDGPQSLPGTEKPLRCHDPADCPPDFVGCPAYAVLRPACHADRDCARESVCAWDGYCTAPPPEIAAYMTDDERLAAAVRKATGRTLTASMTMHR